tara:strand:- start:425 stop:1816 length:1392 start_codon:yes stop_codon:yes gene_type:complete
MINLRPYQNEIISSLRTKIKKGAKHLIMCAPTGAGKTIMFSYMIKGAVSKGLKCLILTDRTELLTQSGGALNNFGLDFSEIKPTNKPTVLNGNLYIAMAQTLSRRIKQELYVEWFDNLDLIIIDEAHKQTFNNLIEYVNKNTIVIGATATPLRDKNQKSLHNFYQTLTDEVSVLDLINLGYLSAPKTFGVSVDLSNVKTKGMDYDTTSMGNMYDESKMYDGVYQNYMRLTPNKKALIFASSVKSSKKIVSELINKGLPAKHIDGNTPKKERKEVLEWFVNTKDAMLSNVGILNAGFDCPSIEVVILYRATKSLPLFLQMVGRGSRTTETKKEFTILDFGNNIKTHGHWQEERAWSLIKKKKREGIAPIKECSKCKSIVLAQAKECNYCGFVFPINKKEIEKINLINLKFKAKFDKIIEKQKLNGYKSSWIFHQLKTKKDFELYAEYKNYKKGWVYTQKNKWQK